MKVLEFAYVCRVGPVFREAQRGERVMNYEGIGTSVTRQPDEWRHLLGKAGGPVFELRRSDDQPGRFAWAPSIAEAAIKWGTDEGYLLDAPRFILVKAEHREYLEDLVPLLTSLVGLVAASRLWPPDRYLQPCSKLATRLTAAYGQYSGVHPSVLGEMLNMWARNADHTLDGVWYPETGGFADRGIIWDERLPSWTDQRVRRPGRILDRSDVPDSPT